MTRPQQKLLDRARRTLAAARLLLRNGYLEESLSRSYYSMFYTARALLAGEGLSFSKHSAVIAAFGQRLVQTGRIPVEYHRFLRTAQDMRLGGDYNVDYAAVTEEVEEQIARAESFLRLAEPLLAAPTESK